jgi:hypothetical protein
MILYEFKFKHNKNQQAPLSFGAGYAKPRMSGFREYNLVPAM